MKKGLAYPCAVNVRLAITFAAASALGIVLSAQSASMTVVLAGQSMIRSDIRATAPAAVPAIQDC